MIIGLIRYVSKEYLSDFELTDESLFWETSDRVLLEANFQKNSRLLSAFGSALSQTQRLPNESAEECLKRILKDFRSKND